MIHPNASYPLHLAMKHHRRDLFEEHIFNYDLDAQDREGRTPLHFAAMYKTTFYSEFYTKPSHFRIVDIEGWTPIYYAIKTGWNDFVKSALELDPKLSLHKDYWGLTPAHVAIIYNKLDIFRCLLEYGDPSVLTLKDVMGRTPLHEAIYWFNEEAVRIIREFDNFAIPLIDITDGEGFTPVDILERKMYLMGEDVPSGLKVTFANPAHNVIGQSKNLFDYLLGDNLRDPDLDSISLDPLDETDNPLDSRATNE